VKAEVAKDGPLPEAHLNVLDLENVSRIDGEAPATERPRQTAASG